MRRLCAFSLVLPALCGCSIFSSEPRPEDPPPAPAKTETHAAPQPMPTRSAEPCVADADWVKWDMEHLMPKCPHCGQEVKLRSSICPGCYTRYKWHDVPVEETPRGAFDKLKLAEIYSDVQTFRECVCLADMRQIESTVGTHADTDRLTLLEPQVVDEQVSGDRATLTIVQRGKPVKLHLAMEGGSWKFSLSSLREDVHLDQARVLVAQLAEALDCYVAEHGAPPSKERWVTELGSRSSTGRPYFSLEGVVTRQEISHEVPGSRWLSVAKATSHLSDPWGHDIIYRPGEGDGRRPFVIYSVGPDGRDEGGAGDDILPQ